MAYLVVESIPLSPVLASGSFPVSIAQLGLSLVNDDWLVLGILYGGTTGTLSVAGTGWTELSELDVTSGQRMGIYACKVASGTAANPTVSISSGTGFWMACISQVRDADATDLKDSVITSEANAVSIVTGTMTPVADNCLILYFSSGRSTGATGTHRYLATNVVGRLSQSADDGSVLLDYSIGTVQQIAKAATAQTMYANFSKRLGTIVLAIKNKASGGIETDSRAGITKMAWMGNYGVAHEALSTTWGAPSTFCSSLPTINGMSTDTLAPTIVNNSDTGSNVASATNTAGLWCGGWFPLPATIDASGKLLSVEFFVGLAGTPLGPKGACIAFGDDIAANTGNAVVYQLLELGNIVQNRPYTIFINPATATPLQATAGAINWATVKKVGIFFHRYNSSANSRSVTFKNLLAHSNTVMTGGSIGKPLDVRFLDKVLNGWAYTGACSRQGDAILAKTPIQFGDGTIPTYVDTTATLLNTPEAFNSITQNLWNAQGGALTIGIKASASDTINYIAASTVAGCEQVFTIDAASSTSAAYSFVGQTFSRVLPTFKAGVTVNGAVFSKCNTAAFKGANVTDCTLSATTSTNATCSQDTSGATMTRCTINTPATAAYHIELGTAVTALALEDVTFAGAPATNKIHVLATTGTVTITISGSTSLTSGQVTSAGATVVISAPTYQRGQNFTGLVAGSQVKVFATGTDTEKFSTNSSGTSETWDDATSGAVTVDYVIQKAGYLPIRVVGVVLTGALSGGVIATPITQSIDRAWAASSGLTLNTNFFANATTKLAGLTVASTVQNVYSYLIEQWIALGGTGGAYANKAFPMVANGPNSFSWLNGWTFDLTTYSASITNLSRDGMRYLNTSGNVTAMWAALLSVGVPTGEKVRYRQSDSGTTTDAQATGNIDQLIKILDDPNGDGVYSDGYDRRGFLALKCQADGYDEAATDAIATYGNLEDQLYVVGLTPLSNGLATGNPSLANPPVITDHGASPVTWNGKVFSITITDSAAGNSGTLIERWLRYNYELGGTFQGVNAFCWHDLVQTNGSKFKTVRGAIYGDTGAALKGVRVVRNDGATAHTDFDLFTADDGTTYSPPVTANVSITGMPDAGGAYDRLQVINFTATTAASRANSTAYALGDIRLRQTGIGSENTAGLYLRCTAAGTSAASPPTWNTTPGGTTADGTATWTTYKVLFYDADPASTSMGTTYTNGNEFLSGESVKIRFAEMNAGTSFKTFSTTTIASSAGFSVVVDELADDVYATNALDGSSYETTFSPNFGANYIVLDTNTDFSGKSAYAYFCFTLTSSSGMYLFWGGVTALDTGNYRIETDVLDIYFDETLGFVKQTDAVRIFRKDGLRPAIDPTTGGFGIEINWRTPVSVVSTGGSALTPTESSQLMSLPAASATATAVLAAANTTPIHADARKMNGSTINGTGIASDQWRGA